MNYASSPLGIPEETVRLARRSFAKGNVYIQMRDEIGMVYRDSHFAHLFSHAGRPAEAPGNLALVMVLQYMEGLTDQQAAEQVRARLDWKYLLGLEADDAGFHHDVLRYFRQRLLQGGEVDALLNHMLRHFVAKGWVKAGGKQRTDSTHVLAKVRNLNRLELVGETLRNALDALAESAPEWLMQQISREWQLRYALRFEAYRLPKSAQEQKALADQIGADGAYLLHCLYAEQTPPSLSRLSEVEIMRCIWLQQYQIQAGEIRQREQKALPPAALLIESPYDVEAHYSYKRDIEWVGYKAHYTESCQDTEVPNLITHVVTTASTTQDREVVEEIHQALQAKELLPAEHFLDQGYVDAHNLAESTFDHEVELLGPAPPDTSWQAKADEGFDLTVFAIDWPGKTITCPQGKLSVGWYPHHDTFGKESIMVEFAKADCQPCAKRSLCTRAQGGRRVKVRPQREHTALQSARQRQMTEDFRQRYKARAGIEGTLSQACRIFDLRRTRFCGLDKTHLHHVLIAAALNFKRVLAFLAEVPRAMTRTSSFLSLQFT
jgi:transposase